MYADNTRSSSPYSGRLSESFCPGRSSALGALTMLLTGIITPSGSGTPASRRSLPTTASPPMPMPAAAALLRQRASSHTRVLSRSLIGAYPPTASP